MFLDQALKLVIGSKNERELKKLQPRVAAIGALEPSLQGLGDEQLRAKTAEFRARLEQGEELDDLLHEAFAVVREAGRRVLGMRHFDVQLIGGMVLHQGKIAEMKTGEGKTLVATLPAYLNALPGKGVHIITVNDYLARRDADWMGRIYRFLGLSVGVIQHELTDAQRQVAYGADVTYGTNNEFGFDYLRDNMKYSLDSFVQRGHVFAIVDEVDSILIDEARTPLIISGPSDESTDKYYESDRIIPRLKQEDDFKVDEKARTVNLTETGVETVEKALGVPNLYDPEFMELNHCVQQALRAHILFRRDVDYMVKEGQVVIVDEFTGRLMPGRRWSDGLHQAVEAKEKVKIEKENQTLATITFQNYFRMYDKLSGMTGTADTEAVEFDKIYKLEVTIVPTNRDLIRVENPDVIYRTEEEKYRAVVGEIEELHQKGQPVLVGTVSIEKSEHLSSLLKRKGVPHVVLNAKYHEREAEIVAQAGRLAAVTIATNMAGRGTDILLGGNPEFQAKRAVTSQTLETPEQAEAALTAALEEARAHCVEEHDRVVVLGGLHILGTERHEARRIDNQLRGRAGRQGDPGSSRFYLSLEDDLLRIFGSDRLKGLMLKLGMEEDVPIIHPMVSRSIERAQKQVEARNFDIRKHLLEYDDVMNMQRVEIYSLRRELLEGKGQSEYLSTKMEDILDWILDTYAPEGVDPEEWSIPEMTLQMQRQFGIDPVKAGVDFHAVSRAELRKALWEAIGKRYAEKEAALGPEIMRQHERLVMLNVIDTQWKDHLLNMDHLKEGIGLRGYGQRDPLTEYKRESFEMFSAMKERIENDIVRFLFLMEPVIQKEREQMQEKRERDLTYSAPAKEAAEPRRAAAGTKVGRNDPCPCGSGKKYKKCHGAAEGKVVHGVRG
ncbi:MAG TPA: preprotein translocase subunit SecA [Candidatus Polarisedimenticolia bacterium]|nr:preprotein translocase subunit SecA [Candidatus Polarisedimenticolia bacterium]